MAKQRGGVSFVQQVLFYPVTDASFDTDSYHQFAEGYFLRRDAMQWFWDQYTTDPAQRARDHRLAAARHRSSELAGLPPALVITGEADVLRDEGEAYASKLRDGRRAGHRGALPGHHPRLRHAQRPARHPRRRAPPSRRRSPPSTQPCTLPPDNHALGSRRLQRPPPPLPKAQS